MFLIQFQKVDATTPVFSTCTSDTLGFNRRGLQTADVSQIDSTPYFRTHTSTHKRTFFPEKIKYREKETTLATVKKFLILLRFITKLGADKPSQEILKKCEK